MRLVYAHLNPPVDMTKCASVSMTLADGRKAAAFVAVSDDRKVTAQRIREARSAVRNLVNDAELKEVGSE
jgi:hypothetical protein